MQKKAIITTLSVMMATIIASVALVFAVGPLVSAARIDDGEPKIITISDWNDFEIDENGVCYGFSGSLLCDFLHFVEVGCGDLGPGDDSPEFDEMHIVIPEGVKSIAYQAFAPGGAGAYRMEV